MNFIKKYLNNLKYGTRNYNTEIRLDVLSIYLDEIGIKSIHYTRNDYEIVMEFNDGTILKGWNENKWYAWLSSGEINFSNGKLIRWSKKMPNVELALRLKKIVKNFDNQKYDNFDHTQYLPKSLIRKLKLEKLEKSK